MNINIHEPDFYDQMIEKWHKDGPLYIDDDSRLFPKPVEEVIFSQEDLEDPNYKIWSKVSPKHYKDIVPGYEYMDIMEHVLGFEGTVEHLRGQIFKYLFRLHRKDADRLEVGKIAWYAKRLEDVYDRKEKGEFPIKK